MKYIVEDALGQVFPITNMINANEEAVDDIQKAVAIVVQINPDSYLPMTAEECPFNIYTVH